MLEAIETVPGNKYGPLVNEAVRRALPQILADRGQRISTV